VPVETKKTSRGDWKKESREKTGKLSLWDNPQKVYKHVLRPTGGKTAGRVVEKTHRQKTGFWGDGD